MKNIKLVQVVDNHWVVRADTKGFGVQAILFEGSFDTALAYIGKNVFMTGAEKYTVHITGEKDGVRFNNDWLTVHSNGFIERDWDKLFEGE